MTKVVLAGAGGKMGLRLTSNLKNSDYEMSYVEISPQGMAKLGEERRKLKGTPVETITRVYGQGGAPGMPPGAAGDAARNDARQGALARMGGLGRLGGMLGRKDSDSPSPASAPPSGAAPVANAAPTLFRRPLKSRRATSRSRTRC